MHTLGRLPTVFVFLVLIGTIGVGAAQTSPHGSDASGGQIVVFVQDPSGRPLPAHGNLYGPAGKARQLNAGLDGSINVTNLPYGKYKLQLWRRGFEEETIQLEVSSTLPLRRHITLRVEGLRTRIDVTGVSPVGNLDVPISDVPIPVQTMTRETIKATNAIDLTDALKRRFNDVYVNENQNNPFQPDVNYRGYTAPPLVGSPAGLSVYLDGVRQNQPFGDVVAWDLIPKISIGTVQLIPGSDPLYGLNTLGGAISVRTKDGLTDPGYSVSSYGGSFGRRSIEAQYGGSSSGGPNWLAAGTLFHEDGWRVQSPSSVRQSFARFGYDRGSTSLALSGGYAINDLTGNGTQDLRALERTTGLNHGYSSVYSIPDRTRQHSPFLTFNATHAAGNGLVWNANLYFRSIRTNTTNGDINDDSFDQSLYNLSAADKAALSGAGIAYPANITPQNTPFPYLRCLAQVLQSDEPGEKCTGVDTDTLNRQHAYGASTVLSWHARRNRFSLGGGWDHGSLSFGQTAQYGYINADGIIITRTSAYLDGSTSVDGSPQDNRVDLHGTTNTPSLFAADTVSFGKWVVHAAGRYNHTKIQNTDRLPPVPYRGTLTAVNRFGRFNPSAGIVYKAFSLLNAYFDYSEGSRAPTSTELGCADPDFPCSLPNALVSDPPLKQVIARTTEAGVRGDLKDALHWNAGIFDAHNDDDLLFVASRQTGYGYFKNFGQTRRMGVEAAVSGHTRQLEAGAGYTFLKATYESTQTIASGSNSSNSNAIEGAKGVDDGDVIQILPGDHIPEVPQHMLKLYADYRASRKLSLDADVQLVSASYVRGNENNLHRPDGVYYLGPGQSPGYGVLNVGAHYRPVPHYELFIQINNALNRHYYTGGQLAATPYDATGNFAPRPFAATQVGGETVYPIRNSTFLSPGAPVTVFGGLVVTYGRK